MALDVVVRMTAQEAGAYRAWVEQQRAVEGTAKGIKGLTTAAGEAGGKVGDLEAKLTQIAANAGRVTTETGRTKVNFDQLGASTAAAGKELGQYFAGQAARWVSVAGGIGLATSAIRKLAAAQREVRTEEAETTFSLDATFRRLQVQGQLGDAEMPAARARIFEIARSEAAPLEMVSEASKQLISSGFSAKEVIHGGAGREMVQAIKATTAEGEDFDVRQASESITQFIMAQVRPEDRELNRENLRKVLRQTQGLYIQRNIQFEDLTDLAKAAPALSGAGIDTTTQLALFTKLRDTLDSEQSGTSLRNLVIRMTTAGTSDKKTGALAQMGLTPEDVDLEGEDIETALRRMKRGLAKLSPSAASGVLKEIFEERGMLGARTLIENVGDIDKYRREALDETRFERALETATSGPAAAKTRLEVEKQQSRFMGEGAKNELIARKLETATPGAFGKIGRWVFETAIDYGMDPKRALAHGAFGNRDVTRFVHQEIERELTPRERPKRKDAKPATAPLTDIEQAFEIEESQRDAMRQAKIAEAEKAELAKVEEIEAGLRVEAGNKGRKLVLTSLADPKRARGATRQLIEAEARAVEEGFRSQRLSKLSGDLLDRWHEAVLKKMGSFFPAGTREAAAREEKMLVLLEELVANTADKSVHVENIDDWAKQQDKKDARTKRVQRRLSPAAPPLGDLGE